MLPPFNFDSDPDPAFQSNADLEPAFQLDADPASQNDADPCGFGSATLLPPVPDSYLTDTDPDTAESESQNNV